MNSTAITRSCHGSRTGLTQLYTRAFGTSTLRLSQKNDDELKHDKKDDLKSQETSPRRKKTMKELDEELQAAMEGRSGDGGISGAELEGGKAVAMKRGMEVQAELVAN